MFFVNETSLDFGQEDIFIAFTGTFFHLWEWIAWVPCILMQFSSWKGSFFAIIFGFVAILFGVFRPKEPFFIIGEEEDFLDSLFLFKDEPSWSLFIDVELQVIVNR